MTDDTVFMFNKEEDRSAAIEFRRAEDVFSAEETTSASSQLAASRPLALESRGGSDSEKITGSGDADRLFGGGGDDTLKGAGGDDRIFGGGGNDRLLGNGGKDFIKGNGGDDALIAGGGDDRAIGGGGADLIKAGGGDDFAKGNGGADRLVGGKGDDKLKGGGGNDTIDGGKGSDKLGGGGGEDIFTFKTKDFKKGEVDTITGFSLTQDKIDLSKTGVSSAFENLIFSFVGNFVAVEVDGGRIVFSGITDPTRFSASNFILPEGNDGGTGGGTDPSGGTIVINADGIREIRGSEDDDILSGTAENEILLGFGGDDKLAAGDGADTLFGGGGRDIYVIRRAGFGEEIDVVKDFDYPGGDRIGLTEILAGVSFDQLSEVVRVTPDGGDTMIAIKDGATFRDTLLLEGVEFTLAQLESYGFTAPPRNSATFIENPYGFDNNTETSLDPIATRDGRFIAFIDKQNLDGNPEDIDPGSSVNESSVTPDIFVRNTETGTLIRANVDADGAIIKSAFGGRARSEAPALSEDGRFVIFSTDGIGNANDQNNSGDIYIRDLLLDTGPELISVGLDGLATGGVRLFTNGDQTGSASVADISADGNLVAFASSVDPTGAGTTGTQVYLRDVAAGITTLVSTDADGTAIGARGDGVSITEDGRFVAFRTQPEGSTDSQVFLKDVATGRILQVTDTPTGTGVGQFSMSADGTRIAFSTSAALDADDFNEASDIYFVTINTSALTVDQPERLSEVDGRFELKGGGSFAPTISPDGQKVAFISDSTDFKHFDPDERFIGGDPERLFVVDIATREVTSPEFSIAQDADNSQTNASLTDTGIVYRRFVPNAETSSNDHGDTIAIQSLEPLPKVDIGPEPGEPFELNSQAISRFSFIRSEISSANDVDVFRIDDRESDRFVSVTVEGLDSKGGTLADAKVTIFDRNRNEVDTDLDSGVGRDPYIRFLAQNNRDYYAQVEGENGATGSYRLRFIESETPSSDRDTPLFLVEGDAPFANNTAITRPDWFKFDMVEGEDYTVNLNGVSGAIATSLINVMTEDEVIFGTSPTGASSFTFTGTDTGLGFIEITSTTSSSFSYEVDLA
ncbi:MAG: type I secretion C-terminal target domain-containing protein [Pseudomonadota bacterium]